MMDAPGGEREGALEHSAGNWLQTATLLLRRRNRGRWAGSERVGRGQGGEADAENGPFFLLEARGPAVGDSGRAVTMSGLREGSEHWK